MPKKKLKEIIAVLIKLLKEHHDPHGIALGVAIGSFIGILPLYGLHTVLFIIALFLIPRANKLSMLVGTNISLPPTIATLTWTSYDIGRILLVSKHYPPLSWQYLKDFKISRLSEFYYPLFIGSVVLGLLVALVLYLVTRAIANHLRKKYALKK